MARTTETEVDPTTETQTERERRERAAGASPTPGGTSGSSGATPTTGGMTQTSATSGPGSGSPLGGGSPSGPSGTHATQAGTEGQLGRTGEQGQGRTGGLGGQGTGSQSTAGVSSGMGQGQGQGMTQGGQGAATGLGTQSATAGAGSQGMTAGGAGQGMTSAEPRGQGLSRPGDLFQSLWDSPFAVMRRMVDEMDRLFDSFPGRQRSYGGGGALGRGLGGRLGEGLWAPQIEVSEREGNLVVCADLPGLNRDDLHVEIQEGNLVLQGERRSEHQDERGWSERSYGRFYRMVPLPEGVDPEQANATFKDGVLEIKLPLPRQEQQRGRRIDIR